MDKSEQAKSLLEIKDNYLGKVLALGSSLRVDMDAVQKRLENGKGADREFDLYVDEVYKTFRKMIQTLKEGVSFIKEKQEGARPVA